MLQMKKKYAAARPYGTWLGAQTVTLDHLLDSVPAAVKMVPPIREASMAPGCVWGGGRGACI